MPYNDTTPWLQIPHWRPLQRYTQFPTHWFAVCTDLFKDPKKRARWEKHGEGFLHLILELWTQAATEGLYGILWGDPCRLRRELGYKQPIDLGLLEQEHFIRYITDEERDQEIVRMNQEQPELVEGRKPKNGKRRGDYRGEKKGQEQKQPQGPEQTPTPGQPQPDTDPPSARATETDPLPKSQAQPPEPPPKPQDKTPRLPAETSTLPPQRSGDPPETATLWPRPDPLGSLVPNPRRQPPEVQLLRDCFREALGPLRLGQACPAADDWVLAVYAALKLPWPAESPLWRQNCGAFHSVYQKLMALPLSGEMKARILAHDLADAEKIAVDRKTKHPAKRFMHVHKGRVETYLGRMRGRG